MTLKSLYHFLRTYFNYTSSGKIQYAMAVSDAMGVIRASAKQKSLVPILLYLHKPYARSITKDMLLRLVSLAMREYKDPFREVQYFKITATIDKSLITTNHRGINIPIEGGYDSKNSKLILFTFSQPNNMEEEVRVIKGLIEEFVTSSTPLSPIKTIAYWDLSKGRPAEIGYDTIEQVSRLSLIDGANRIK